MARVHRRSIQFAPYNPRTIDRHALGKLRENLKRVGLVSPIVWNETTGNVVSGHQRLRAMDELEGSDDYYLDVAKVTLDPETERHQNVFMNNDSAQGTWDLGLLENLVLSPDLKFDPAKAGFDPIDLEELVPKAGQSVFSIETATPEAKAVMAQVQDFAAEVESTKDAKDAERPSEVEEGGEEEEEAEESTSEDAGEAPVSPPPTRLQDKKNAYRAERKEEMDTGFFLVITFSTRQRREEFCQSVGLPHNSEYVDGGRFETIVADAQAGKVAAAKLGALIPETAPPVPS